MFADRRGHRRAGRSHAAGKRDQTHHGETQSGQPATHDVLARAVGATLKRPDRTVPRMPRSHASVLARLGCEKAPQMPHPETLPLVVDVNQPTPRGVRGQVNDSPLSDSAMLGCASLASLRIRVRGAATSRGCGRALRHDYERKPGRERSWSEPKSRAGRDRTPTVIRPAPTASVGSGTFVSGDSDLWQWFVRDVWQRDSQLMAADRLIRLAVLGSAAPVADSCCRGRSRSSGRSRSRAQATPGPRAPPPPRGGPRGSASSSRRTPGRRGVP